MNRCDVTAEIVYFFQMLLLHDLSPYKVIFSSIFITDNREVKHDVNGKRQTAKMELLPSVFSSLYSRIKIFVFAGNSKRHFSIFV